MKKLVDVRIYKGEMTVTDSKGVMKEGSVMVAVDELTRYRLKTVAAENRCTVKELVGALAVLSRCCYSELPDENGLWERVRRFIQDTIAERRRVEK